MRALLWLGAWATLVSPANACELEVEALAIGQGDSILIRNSNGMAILVDAGTESSPIEALLAERGVKTLDLAIGTHPHADHIGGMDRVIRAVDVLTYADNGMKHDTRSYLSVMEAIEERPTTHEVVREGDNWVFGDVRVSVLFPSSRLLSKTRSDLNANSVVLQIDHLKDCFLLTGDAEEVTEDALMDAGLDSCDVLKVGHHGSKYSSSPRFLSRVAPQIAVIPVGSPNRYKHPHKETLDRLKSLSVEVWRTDIHGSVRFLSKGAGVSVVPGGTVVETPKEPKRVTAEKAVITASEPHGKETPKPTHADKPTTFGEYSSGKSTTPYCAWVGHKNKRVVYKASCPQAQKIPQDLRVCYPNATVPKTLGRKMRSCAPR